MEGVREGGRDVRKREGVREGGEGGEGGGEGGEGGRPGRGKEERREKAGRRVMGE
jgi:hypothetical protein